MATIILADGQSTNEIRTWYIDFTADLPSNVVVNSAVAVHTPPYGTPATPSVVVITSVVHVTLSGLTVTGEHFLDVRATLSDNQVSEVRLIIPVEF